MSKPPSFFKKYGCARIESTTSAPVFKYLYPNFTDEYLPRGSASIDKMVVYDLPTIVETKCQIREDMSTTQKILDAHPLL